VREGRSGHPARSTTTTTPSLLHRAGSTLPHVVPPAPRTTTAGPGRFAQGAGVGSVLHLDHDEPRDPVARVRSRDIALRVDGAINGHFRRHWRRTAPRCGSTSRARVRVDGHVWWKLSSPALPLALGNVTQRPGEPLTPTTCSPDERYTLYVSGGTTCGRAFHPRGGWPCSRRIMMTGSSSHDPCVAATSARPRPARSSEVDWNPRGRCRRHTRHHLLRVKCSPVQG
jgi:hypothetical protein